MKIFYLKKDMYVFKENIFFKTFSEIKHYVNVNDIEGFTTTFKKT